MDIFSLLYNYLLSWYFDNFPFLKNLIIAPIKFRNISQEEIPTFLLPLP